MIERRRDDTDYERRNLANLTATIALLLVALALTWTVRHSEEREAIERCAASGRLDCPAARLSHAELAAPIALSRPR